MSNQPQSGPVLHQQLLTCLRGNWSSLVVVPATPQYSGMVIATALVDLSNVVRGQQARLFTTEGLEISGASKVISDVTAHVDKHGLAIIAVESVIAKQTGIPVTLVADAALLVVHLGITRTEDAKRTVDLIGPEKFIGAVTIESR